MIDIIATAAPLFMLIGAGVLLKLSGLADDQWTDILNNFGLYAGFPALIINSFLSIAPGIQTHFPLMAINACFLITLMAITYCIMGVLKTENRLRNTYTICIFFGNVAYLGLPFISTIFPGTEGLISLHIALYVFILFTLGIMILERSMPNRPGMTIVLKGLFKNPLFLSILVGFGMYAGNLHLPVIARRSISMLAASASPVILIALGIFVARPVSVNRDFVHATAITLIKLAVVPVLFFGVMYAWGFAGMATVSVLESAMPIGLTAFALAQKYPMDRTITAYAIVASTLCASISLPLACLLLR